MSRRDVHTCPFLKTQLSRECNNTNWKVSLASNREPFLVSDKLENCTTVFDVFRNCVFMMFVLFGFSVLTKRTTDVPTAPPPTIINHFVKHVSAATVPNMRHSILAAILQSTMLMTPGHFGAGWRRHLGGALQPVVMLGDAVYCGGEVWDSAGWSEGCAGDAWKHRRQGVATVLRPARTQDLFAIHSFMGMLGWHEAAGAAAKLS